MDGLWLTSTFQVEDSLFNVPKHHFLQSSLRDSLIVTDENHDTPPIQLDGVSKTDFRAILKLLDPLYVQRILFGSHT